MVQTADRVTAEFTDGTMVTARVIASDPSVDLALLKLDSVPEGVIPVSLADSDKVDVGEQVFVIGAPFGLSHSLSVGNISGRHKMEEDAFGSLRAEIFQTDAAINQGNSGGPMFNLKGEVVGIVSYILTKSGGFEGIGFVVTSNTVRQALFENPMFWSGLEGILVQGVLAKALNLGYDSGFLIQKVAAGSVAAKLGLRAGVVPVTIQDRTLLLGGDVIISVEGERVSEENLGQIRKLMQQINVNDRLKLEVIRGGRFIVLEARVPD